jgi:LytS/YehU family sensor histidine kinase
MIFSLFFSVILLLQQYKDKYRGYLLEIITLIITTVFAIVNIVDFENFFVVFPVFIIVLLAIHTFNIQQQRLTLQKSLLKASQLESSLLRKNIQPHFILNSLMSITQWIEDNPKKSIEFVESLADEFRLFAKIAGQSLIPLTQDIELAQYHLDIMSFRLEKNFKLEVKGDIEKDWIPPGIMHTLVENGVTHNKYLQNDIVFKFERCNEGKYITFYLFSPLGKKRATKQTSIGTGTGSKYVKSQFEQVYAKHFEILNEETEEYWLTKISIPHKEYQKQIDDILLKVE